MCTRAGARSVATMTARLIFLAAATALAATAPPAAGAVYGGGTSGGDPIVITAGKDAKSLRSTVVGWTATCDDQSPYSDWETLTPANPRSGFPIGPGDLEMSRNAKGRFQGTEAAVQDLGDQLATVSLTMRGK